MPSVVLTTFSVVCVLSLTACVSAAMETVVGVAGKKVSLPCPTEDLSQSMVGLCWGRGKPSLFTCHNTLLNTNGVQVLFRTSYRYRLADVLNSDVSLTIYDTRLSDSGFYHCRIQVPGLFNDQIYTVHLIITNARITVRPPLEETTPVHTEGSKPTDTPLGYTVATVTEEGGSDVPVVARVKKEELDSEPSSLEGYVGNTVRMAFIIFIPALLLTCYRQVRSQQKPGWTRRRSLSDQEDDSL